MELICVQAMALLHGMWCFFTSCHWESACCNAFKVPFFFFKFSLLFLPPHLRNILRLYILFITAMTNMLRLCVLFTTAMTTIWLRLLHVILEIAPSYNYLTYKLRQNLIFLSYLKNGNHVSLKLGHRYTRKILSY